MLTTSKEQPQVLPEFFYVWDEKKVKAALDAVFLEDIVDKETGRVLAHKGERIIPEEGFNMAFFGSMGVWRKEIIEAISKSTGETVETVEKLIFNGYGYDAGTDFPNHPFREAEILYRTVNLYSSLEKRGEVPVYIDQRQSAITLGSDIGHAILNKVLDPEARVFVAMEQPENGLGEKSIRQRAMVAAYIEVINELSGLSSDFIHLNKDLKGLLQEMNSHVIKSGISLGNIDDTRSRLTQIIDAGPMFDESFTALSGVYVKVDHDGVPVPDTESRRSWQAQIKSTDKVKYIDPADRESRRANNLSTAKGNWGGTFEEMKMAAKDEILQKCRFQQMFINIPCGLNKDSEPAGFGSVSEIGFQIALAHMLGQKLAINIELPGKFNMEIPEIPDSLVATYVERIKKGEIESVKFPEKPEENKNFVDFCKSKKYESNEKVDEHWLEFQASESWKTLFRADLQNRYTQLAYLKKLKKYKLEVFKSVVVSTIVDDKHSRFNKLA